MTLRVGINGFGRIGHSFFRAALRREADLQVVGANAPADAHTPAHPLTHDSTLGRIGQEARAADGRQVKAAGRYDNERGFSHRVVDTALPLGSRL